jgi:Na+/H+ antiporter NhaD/arsenite permease-like protein
MQAKSVGVAAHGQYHAQMQPEFRRQAKTGHAAAYQERNSCNPHTAWLTLVMASTLAGNLTITGSVANIIVVERARKEAAIEFFDYFRIGLPVTLLTLLFGWLWLSFIR